MATWRSKSYDLGVGKYIPYGVVPLVEKYTIQSGTANGDVILMYRIPAGMTVLDVKFTTGGLGTGVTVSVGDSGSATRYINGQSAASNATIGMGTGVQPYYYSADDYIRVTIGGANPSAGNTFTLVVLAAKDVKVS